MAYVNNSNSPGNLFKSYSVMCGSRNCKTVLNHVSAEKHKAEDELRRRGWSKTKESGWVCPVCAANRNPQKVML